MRNFDFDRKRSNSVFGREYGVILLTETWLNHYISLIKFAELTILRRRSLSIRLLLNEQLYAGIPAPTSAPNPQDSGALGGDATNKAMLGTATR